MSCSTICLRVQRLLLTLKRTLLMLVPATLIILSIRLSRRSPSRPLRRKLLLNELDSLAASLGRRSWTLENEVGVIASRVMKSRPTPTVTFPLFEEPWNLMTLLIQTMLWKLNSRKMIYPIVLSMFLIWHSLPRPSCRQISHFRVLPNIHLLVHAESNRTFKLALGHRCPC